MRKFPFVSVSAMRCSSIQNASHACDFVDWRAFGEAVRHATGQCLDTALVVEVQVVRVLLLSKFESGANTRGPSVAERAAAGFDIAPAHHVLQRAMTAL